MSDNRIFWNSCPRKLEAFPTTNCIEGQKSCPWKLNSQAHHYCFWNFVRTNSDSEGSFEPVSDANIMKLLNITSEDFQLSLTEAYAKLAEHLKD